MNSKLLQDNKNKLLAEKAKLQAMLKKDSVLDSEIPGGHKPKFVEVGTEDSENAQESEQFGNDLSVIEDLDARLMKVEGALQRIADKTYGKCMVGGEEIDEKRLAVEPAAETCVAHAKS
jgi:RNA polymerase-binding transcription factor DksA